MFIKKNARSNRLQGDRNWNKMSIENVSKEIAYIQPHNSPPRPTQPQKHLITPIKKHLYFDITWIYYARGC